MQVVSGHNNYSIFNFSLSPKKNIGQEREKFQKFENLNNEKKGFLW